MISPSSGSYTQLSRAANGVVLVTTKRGADGDSYRSNIEFDMSVGFQAASKRYDLLDAEGFMEYKNLSLIHI